MTGDDLWVLHGYRRGSVRLARYLELHTHLLACGATDLTQGVRAAILLRAVLTFAYEGAADADLLEELKKIFTGDIITPAALFAKLKDRVEAADWPCDYEMDSTFVAQEVAIAFVEVFSYLMLA